jgi:acetolactate synthase I/II/III large subunit
MKGYAVVADALVAAGVQAIFSLPGDGNLLVDYELVHRHGMRYIRAVREDGAVMMADGYSRTSGRLGAASVTQGPGLTNTITALTTAVRNRTPMVVITAEPASSDGQNLQIIDQSALVAATGATVVRLLPRDQIAEDVVGAVRAAEVGRCPVVIMVPHDLQRAEVAAPVMPRRTDAVDPIGPSDDELDIAVGIVSSARRPVVIAGVGAARSGAGPAIRAFAERIGAPVATTLQGKDFFAGDPWDLGIVGTFAHPVCDEVVRASDCIIAFGASLNRHTTADNSLLAEKALVRCDIDPAAVGRYVTASADLVGDAAVTASALCEWLDGIDARPTGGRSDGLHERLVPWQARTEPTVRLAPPVMYDVMRALEAMLPADRGLAVDGGRFISAPISCLSIPEPSALLWTLSFGSIGLGIAAAIGGAVARPDRPVVGVVGDGGFMMSALELNTAVRHGLDLIVVVLNDGSYGAEYRTLVRDDMRTDVSLFDWPDLAAVARSLGAEGFVVTDVDADRAVMSDLITKRTGPLVFDVRCSPVVPA